MIKHNYRARREFFATLMFSLFVFTYIFARSPLFVAKGEIVNEVVESVPEAVVHTVERHPNIQLTEPESDIYNAPGSAMVERCQAKGVDEPVIKCEVETAVEPTVEYGVEHWDIPLDAGLQRHIFAVCENYGIKPGIIIAMIERESGFDVDAIGDSGNSLGLMQIQPRWNYERMERLGCYDLLDPYQNITVGVDVLAEYLSNSGGSLEWALMAYNGGPSYANNKVAAGVVSDYAATVIMRSVMWV